MHQWLIGVGQAKACDSHLNKGGWKSLGGVFYGSLPSESLRGDLRGETSRRESLCGEYVVFARSLVFTMRYLRGESSCAVSCRGSFLKYSPLNPTLIQTILPPPAFGCVAVVGRSKA